MRKTTEYLLSTKTYNGQKQDSYSFDEAKIANHLIVDIEGQADTAVATANAHPVQVANLLENITIETNNSNVLMNLSGVAAHYLYGLFGTVAADNVALVGGAVSNAAFRHRLVLPFNLIDGANPYDTGLETFKKQIKVKLNYNSPTADGTFFGTASTMSIDSLQTYLSAEFSELEGVQNPLNDPDFPKFERVVVETFHDIANTQDALRIDLEKDKEYRGVHLIGESKVNGVWVQNNAVLDMTKQLKMMGTARNAVYLDNRAREFRNKTLQRRGIANTVLPGLIDMPFIKYGRGTQTRSSTAANQLYLQVPVVKQTGETRIRLVTDCIRRI